MADQVHAVPDEPPADENDQRPAIPANADLYPDFVGSLIYDVRSLLMSVRGFAGLYPMISTPEDQLAAMDVIKNRTLRR
jgi:hypothetical protein